MDINEVKELWYQIKESLSEDLTDDVAPWIEPLEAVNYENETLTLLTPLQLTATMLNKKGLVVKIRESLRQRVSSNSNVALVYDENLAAKYLKEKKKELSKYIPGQTEEDKKIESAKLSLAQMQSSANLNLNLKFDNFVVGENSKFAYNAAFSVANNPSKKFNPLFIYGASGLGKTHLMQAIGHQMLLERPNAKVVYIQSETFVNDFINSIKNKTQDQFREKYRTCDLLLVDDIQFFAKKEGIQEEFFHTFETLYNDQKQIVMTSDRLPTEIPDLSERLVSRFTWGLQVEITPPDLETRIAILRRKAESEGLTIDDNTLDYIASQVDTNIRELEGALVKVQAYATIEKADIDVNLAREALVDLKLVQKNRGLQISKIQEVVANYFQTSTAELKGKKRVRQIVVPRQIAMYLSRELTDASLPKIGQEFGGKDHTTVMHAYDKIDKQMKTDADIKTAVFDLKQMLEH